jgi:hypothetical protein
MPAPCWDVPQAVTHPGLAFWAMAGNERKPKAATLKPAQIVSFVVLIMVFLPVSQAFIEV